MLNLKLQFKICAAALWDVFQAIFGANKEKCRIYRDTVACNPGDKILDFGCATGITASAFMDCDYLGVDINSGSIEWAKRKYRNYSNIKFECRDIRTLENVKFNKILCAGTGHHLNNNDLNEFMSILVSMLTADGSLYFIDIIRTNQDNAVMKLLMAIDQGRYVRTAEQYHYIFNKIPALIIKNITMLRADGWFTKASFICVEMNSKKSTLQAIQY